jgi:hypothetical protein
MLAQLAALDRLPIFRPSSLNTISATVQAGALRVWRLPAQICRYFAALLTEQRDSVFSGSVSGGDVLSKKGEANVD